MTDINWSPNVNKKVLRDGNDWGEPETIIEDKTRSGKQKRRLYASSTKREFKVAFNFNMSEYSNFRNWFKTVLKKGMYSFNFPMIDSIDKSVMKEYRIKVGGFPRYQNVNGQIVKCTMTWEEE